MGEVAVTPQSFDADTARTVVGDAHARQIEAKARKDADAGVFDPPDALLTVSYWGQVQDAMRLVVYREQFTKRTARNQRKASNAA